MKKTFISLLLAAALAAPCAVAAPSILDIKHSISDNNVVPPESFETKTRELEENFYLKNFILQDGKPRGEKLGTDKEYETRLAQLPTEIEMPYNSIVGKFINMYLGKRRGLVADMLALHSYYGNIFVEELIKEGLPTELQYLPVIESAINPNAVSRAGAAGLWQFMPGTAKGLGMEINSLVDERRDPRSSSRNAAKFFKQLYNIYGDWSLAIAAYNCGPGNVNKALRRAGGGKKDFWEIYNYLPRETRGYVPAFIAANYVMNYYNHHNINPTVVKRHLTTDTVMVSQRVHFKQIADVLNIPIDEIRMLNPMYRKDIIPAGAKSYPLTLPKQQCLSYLMSEKAIMEHEQELYAQRTHVEPGVNRTGDAGDEGQVADQQPSEPEVAQVETIEKVVKKTHTVGRGENIRDIAKIYGVSATDIKRWNSLRRGKVKEGDELVIEVVERVTVENGNKTTTTASVVPNPPRRQEHKSTPVPPPPAQNKKQTTTSTSEKKTHTSTSTQTASGKSGNDNKSTKRTERKKISKKSTETASANSKKSKKQAAAPKPANHKVASGESLEKIAKRHGTTVEAIQKANGMKKGQTMIQPGQNLKIPKEKKSTAKASKNKKDTKANSSKKSTKNSKASSKSSKSSKKKR